jgi:hypothetical protein
LAYWHSGKLSSHKTAFRGMFVERQTFTVYEMKKANATVKIIPSYLKNVLSAYT